MRIVASVLLLAVPLLLLGPVHADDEDVDALPAKTARLLERVAKDLAGCGCREESEIVRDVLLRLGHDPAAIRRLRTACERAGVRGKPSPGRLARCRKMLAPAVDALCDHLDAVSADRWELVATQILRLDASRDSAHEMLEHERTDDGWESPELAATREGRERVHAVLMRARKRAFAITHGESEELLFRGVLGKAGHKVFWSNVELHGALPPDRLERILEEALRARSVSQEILTGSPNLEKLRTPRRFLLMPSKSSFLRALDEALRDERISTEDHRAAQSMSTFWYDASKRTLVVRFLAEAPALAVLLYHLSDWKYASPLRKRRVQPCLAAGHVNWVCLSYLGVPMPGLRWEDVDERVVEGAGTGAEAGERVVRERVMRLSRLGIVGCRSWMAYLARRREDPPWTSSFLDAEGAIRGNPLLKATTVVAYLQERGRLREILEGTARPRSEKPVRVTPALFEEALGHPLSELEESWRRWIVPEDTCVLARLRGAGPMEPSPAERDALAELDRIRTLAFADRGLGDFVPLVVVPELSTGALAHARYLSRHPEQLAAWPDAHEEWPDREGFSVEGSAAGLRSVIAPDARTPDLAIESWMGTFYHRLPLLALGLQGVGWGHEKGIAVLDAGSLVEPWTSEERFVLWPPDGMKGVPLRFRPELPNPVPGESQAAWGYPITLQGGLYDPRITMRLHAGKAEPANEVPCHLSTPFAPTNPELAPDGAACLIPKAALRPSTRYTVVVENLPGGRKLEWSFRTGR